MGLPSFDGNELRAIEFAPNLIRRSLMIMKIENKKDQDDILKKIEKLIKSSQESEKLGESEKPEKPEKQEKEKVDVWE